MECDTLLPQSLPNGHAPVYPYANGYVYPLPCFSSFFKVWAHSLTIILDFKVHIALSLLKYFFVEEK